MKKSKVKTDLKEIDEFQRKYRDKFHITDKYLIGLEWDPEDSQDNGFIVFIDYENDLDYVDNRTLDQTRRKEQTCQIAKLQKAEAMLCKHLFESQQMDFKRMLGAGYMNALNGHYEEVDNIIGEANEYLKKRNREYSRMLFLGSGMPMAILALGGLIWVYSAGFVNSWLYGLSFGIMGAFVSIWTRYGEIRFTGQSHWGLHLLECYSRILIGTIFALIAMVAIQCKLILPDLTDQEELYAFILASFIAAFSERFIPSIVEKITSESNEK